jgi:hypothetical protein
MSELCPHVGAVVGQAAGSVGSQKVRWLVSAQVAAQVTSV